LEGAVRRFTPVFDRVIVSVGDLSKYGELPAEKVVDIYKGSGPMSGLHASLYTGGDVFLTAADMPFSSPAAALKIIELCGDNDICAMTDKDGRYEPLFAYYKKSVLPRAETALKEGRNSMLTLYEGLRVRAVTAAELGELWDERLILNINRPEDYEKLRLELDNKKC
jgi:molybdopterin-guanine dinucleotide biosynthesis protein A